MSIAAEIYARVMAERISKVIATEIKYGVVNELDYAARALHYAVKSGGAYDKMMNELADEKLRR